MPVITQPKPGVARIVEDRTMYTPGPWTVDACPDANGFDTIREADGGQHGDTDGQPIATVYTPANARLIAAAPKLLAVVADLVAVWDSYDETGPEPLDSLIERARAAIAKARGE